jgi:hypothetical protein
MQTHITRVLKAHRTRRQVISCIQWVPGRRGVVAVAATDPASHQERLAWAGRLQDAYVLIWNLRCWGSGLWPGVGAGLGLCWRRPQIPAKPLPTDSQLQPADSKRHQPTESTPRDPIRPECVLESPHEVFAFQINPLNPNVIAGGCYNGQVRGGWVVCACACVCWLLHYTPSLLHTPSLYTR